MAKYLQASRFAVLAALVGVLIAGCASRVDSRTEAETLVTRARWTVEHFQTRQDDANVLFRQRLKTAHAIAVFPTVTKGAFFVGAAGGQGVILARRPDGSWSDPAFARLTGGSFGLQFGGQSAQVVLLIRSPEALDALLTHPGAIGGEVQMTLGNWGSGLGAATTTNIGADITAFAQAQGVFFGMSLGGAVIERLDSLNAAYYGSQTVSARSILKEGKYVNPGSEPLVAALAVR
ncbi:MAG: lipid-binding SYLF domain-containing protein [Defluviicoccus sp.]|nr:lipid-binding SYLF domain-containing protein [Defluviicoccus sp.]MDG4592889.1 lipid-binding SYLF domain-containing protein [Defluviicoccus sp.]MDS4073689.1 lipid-binding SYLF domain-containing protein [Defluviicoccus sp.]